MPRATQSSRRYRPRRSRPRIRIEEPLPPAPRGRWGIAARLFLAAKSLPIVLLLFAALTIWLGLHVRNDSAAERNWPTVPGTIQSVDRINVVCGGYSPHGGSIPRTCPRYRTTYAYQIDGIAYTGTINGIYEGDSPLRVYYHPRDPATSVITPGGDRSGPVLITAGVAIALIAPIAWVRAFRYRWKTTFAPAPEPEPESEPEPELPAEPAESAASDDPAAPDDLAAQDRPPDRAPE